MSQKSTIILLPDGLREAIDRAIREGRATVDDLVQMVNEAGHRVSRSAMGRHRKKAADALQHYRDSQEAARLWMEQRDQDPEGDVGQLLNEMLKSIAFTTQRGMQGIEADPKALTMLARAVKDINATDRLKEAMRRDIEKAALARAAKAAVNVGKKLGLDKARLGELRREMLGLKPSQASAENAS